MKFTRRSLEIISFNSMGIFSFDSFHGFFQSIDIRPRQERIAQELKDQNSDIICLQEVHTFQFLNLLRKKLVAHPYVTYKPFLFGPRGGLVTFSKLPFVETRYINFKKRGSLFNSSIISHVIRNGILLCKLKDISWVVLNVHATPNLDHDHKQENRFERYIEAQLKQIALLVKSFDKEKTVVVAGDLNTAKDEPNYSRFISETSLEDLFANFSSPTQHQEFLPRNKIVKRIDYVLLKSKKNMTKTIKAFEVFTEKVKLKSGKERFLSDHVGLKVEIRL